MVELIKKRKAKRQELRIANVENLTLRRKRDLALLYRMGLADGQQDEEIRQVNDWNIETLELAKKVFYEIEEAEVISRSSKCVFVEYLTRQLGLIKELNTFILKSNIVSAATAHVSAIKAKSEIYDKIIDRAMTLGFLKRERSSMILEEELDLSDVSNPDLAERLRASFADLNILMSKGNPMILNKSDGFTDVEIMPKIKTKRKLKLKRKIMES